MNQSLKKSLALTLLVFPAAVSAEPAPSVANDGTQEISGVVRLIRASPQTEVFFKDLKDSVVIPFDSRHNSIYQACEDSRKTGKPVRLVVNPKTRHAVGLPSSQEKPSDKADSLPSAEPAKAIEAPATPSTK